MLSEEGTWDRQHTLLDVAYIHTYSTCLTQQRCLRNSSCDNASRVPRPETRFPSLVCFHSYIHTYIHTYTLLIYKLFRTAKLSFFEDRIEAVPLTNGGMAYIQRPIAPKGEGVLGADDSEDAEESYACTYRVSVGPMEVSKLKFRLKLGEFFRILFAPAYYHAHDLIKYGRST